MNTFAIAIVVALIIAGLAFVWWIVHRMDIDAKLFHMNIGILEKRAQDAKTDNELRIVHFDLANYSRSLGMVPRLWAARLREVSAFINGRLSGRSKRWIYVRCLVRKADPGQVSLMSGLVEKVTGKPQPDIIPEIHAGSLSFEHTFVDAADEDEAYARGPDTLPEVPDDVLCLNDYVIEPEVTHLMIARPQSR